MKQILLTVAALVAAVTARAGNPVIDAIYDTCAMNALSVGLDVGGKTVFTYVRATESASSNEVSWAADGVTHYVKTKKSKKPFDAETPLETASVTKTVTAMLVLQLVTEGKIALEDPVVKFIPEYPDPEVTVLNMLTHTSGWRAKGGIDQKDKPAFYKAMAREFPRGREFRYFSSGYDVLIDLVERVTGERKGADLAKKRIFDPLGMTHSAMKHHVGQVGLTTTVGDMLLLGREILDVRRTGKRGKAFDPETVKLMMMPVLKKGFWRTPVFFINNMRYTGFCQSFGKRNSSAAVGHGGSSGCYFLLDPELDAVGVILSRSPKAAIHVKNLYGPVFDAMFNGTNAAQAAADNLVPNGGFELGAVGWHVRTTRPRMDEWTCAPVSAPTEGAWRGRSLRIDVPQGATVRVSSEPLHLEPGVRYFVSARVKAETPGRTSLCLAAPVLNDWWSAGTRGADVSNDWRRIEGAITFAKGHHEALLTVDWNRPGAFWIDDVRVCREETSAFAPRGGFEAGFDLDDTYAAPGPRKLRFRAVGYARDETRDIVLTAEHPATGWRRTRTVRMDLKRGVATEQTVDFDLPHCGELRLSSDAPGDIPVHFAVMPEITEPFPVLGEDFSVGVNETGVFPPIGSWDQNYQGVGRSFAEHLALLRACGVQHVRAFNEDFSHFALFNPERGVYDTSRLEPWLRAMAEAGLPYYMTLKFNFGRRRDLDGWKHWSAERTKRWYLFRESRPTGRPSPTWPKVKEEILPNVDDVAAICAELAKACKGKVGWYEIFNEPNLELHDPADCVRYQKAICEAMKKADPDCRLAGICTTQDFGVEGAADFVGGCLRNGIAPYLDAVAFHPYSASMDNGVCPAAPFLRTLRDLVRPYPHVQLWNTECFYLLNRGDHPVWRKKDPMFLRPQNLVRRCLVDLGEGVRVSSSVHVMQLFRPHFDEMTQHTGEHSGYRLTPTDAAVGLAAFSKLMNRATAVRPLEGSLPEGLCGYLYKLADGRPVAVLWAFEDRRKFIVWTETAAYDMYGNLLERGDVLIDERPVYVIGADDPEAFFRSLAIRHERPVVENGRRRIDADTVAVEILDLVANTGRTEFRRPVAGDPERFGKTLRSGEKAQVGPLGFSVTLADEGVVVEAHTVDTNRIVGTGQQPWTGDTIELFFDANPHGGLDVSRDAPGTFRLFVLPPTPDPADDPKHRPRQLATNTRKLDVRGISQRIDADERGFGCKLTIPWSYFGGRRLDAIGFDIIADDFDPATRRRTAAHVWSGDDANYESRFKWGRVVAD